MPRIISFEFFASSALCEIIRALSSVNWEGAVMNARRHRALGAGVDGAVGVSSDNRLTRADCRRICSAGGGCICRQ